MDLLNAYMYVGVHRYVNAYELTKMAYKYALIFFFTASGGRFFS